MKAPDEIKKGLRDGPEYHVHRGEAYLTYTKLINFREKLHDALAYIQQLEAERDALMADFKLYRERNIKQECGVYACDLCKLGGNYDEWEECKCPKGCMGVNNWEWRGLPEPPKEE